MANLFEGKTALVTGGSRDIGKAIVECLLQEGAKVYVIGRSAENLDKLSTEYPSVNTIQVDVTDWDKTKTAVEHIGTLDLLVNNAGIFENAFFVDTDVDFFDNTIKTNFESAFNITQTVARGMIAARRPGVVLNLSSIAGRRGISGYTAYCVSKAMLDMLTKVTALELGQHNIRVNSVNPGILLTDMTAHLLEDKELVNHYISTIPLQRLVIVEDVVNASLFLLSNESAMITGTTLDLNGGSFMGQ